MLALQCTNAHTMAYKSDYGVCIIFLNEYIDSWGTYIYACAMCTAHREKEFKIQTHNIMQVVKEITVQFMTSTYILNCHISLEAADTESHSNSLRMQSSSSSSLCVVFAVVFIVVLMPQSQYMRLVRNHRNKRTKSNNKINKHKMTRFFSSSSNTCF